MLWLIALLILLIPGVARNLMCSLLNLFGALLAFAVIAGLLH